MAHSSGIKAKPPEVTYGEACERWKDAEEWLSTERKARLIQGEYIKVPRYLPVTSRAPLAPLFLDDERAEFSVIEYRAVLDKPNRKVYVIADDKFIVKAINVFSL